MTDKTIVKKTSLNNLDRLNLTRGSAVAIGNFDGFHLGHRRLMDTLKQIAAEKNLHSIIITLMPNPKVHFGRSLSLISSDEQKKQFFDSIGVEHVIFLDFPEVLHMTGETFVRDVLVSKFNIKHIVMGQNFRFGKNRDSDIETLEKLGKVYDFDFTVVKSLILDGITVSSSLIREKLGNAEIAVTNRMLGRNYFIDGVVTEGEKLGRQLGFPTINIQTTNELLPEGVFQTTVEIDGHPYGSITYIGCRPTFDGQDVKVETHILGFDKEIYGKSVRLFFEKRIRGDMKFDSEMELVQQIKKDINSLDVDKGVVF